MENSKFNTEMVAEINSLDDIERRKDAVLMAIQKDEQRIGVLWNSIFHKPQSHDRSNRWANIMNTGFSIVDGAILGWKLYRKFKQNPFFGKHK